MTTTEPAARLNYSARYQTSEGNHLPEAVYSITIKGKKVLA